jgi:hypothetical protein
VAEPERTRSVTITEARHRVIVFDMARMAVQESGQWWRWPAYVREARAVTRKDLGVGATVTVTYAGGDTLRFEDATERLDVPRGSTPVARFRSLLTLFSPTLTFVVPIELLAPGDIAFLVGAGEDLPLALDVTPQIQDTMVARQTRATLTSADFLIGPVTTLAATALPVGALAAGEWAWGFLMVPLLFLVLMIPSLLGIPQIRRRMREIYPVGLELQGQVTEEQLRVRTGVGTVFAPWASYTALRVSDDAVMLRLRRRVLTATRIQILPLALFGPEELGRLLVAVPRRF